MFLLAFYVSLLELHLVLFLFGRGGGAEYLEFKYCLFCFLKQHESKGFQKSVLTIGLFVAAAGAKKNYGGKSEGKWCVPRPPDFLLWDKK